MPTHGFKGAKHRLHLCDVCSPALYRAPETEITIVEIDLAGQLGIITRTNEDIDCAIARNLPMQALP